MDKLGKVLILGKGMTGLCCAKLLAQQGWAVDLWGAVSKTRQILILNDTTCWLLQDLFKEEVESYLSTSHQLQQRRVIWGHNAAETTVAQPSVVVDNATLTQHLLDRLLNNLSVGIQCAEPYDINDISHQAVEFDWILDATGRTACFATQVGAVSQPFGHRCVLSTEVSLVQGHPP